AQPLTPAPAATAPEPVAVQPVVTTSPAVAVKTEPAAKPAAAPQPFAKPEAKIFVAPRAPDDPGLEQAEPDNVSPLPRRPYRAAN
ncbi:MAG: hypothetical protein WBP38_08620, partial [Hyphomicrobium sp.]